MSRPIVNTRRDVAIDEVAPIPGSLRALSEIPGRWIGRCKRCGRTHKLEGRVMTARGEKYPGALMIDAGGDLYLAGELGTNPYKVVIPCGDHWCTLQLVVEGTKASKHECGARCTNATGPNCDCRCRGKNHGSNL